MEFVTEYDDFTSEEQFREEDLNKVMEILAPALENLEENFTQEKFEAALAKRKEVIDRIPKRMNDAYEDHIYNLGLLSESSKEMVAESLGASVRYEFLKEHFGDDPEFIALVQEGLWDWIKDTADDVWQGTKELANKAMEGLKSLGDFGKAAYKLILSLTEGGTPVGILHLVLDLIGFVDWWGPFPVGMIADIVNGMIYFFYDKNMILGIISIAAAFFMDFLKPLKWLLRPFSKFINRAFGFMVKKGGGKKGGEWAAKNYDQAAKAGQKNGGNPSKLKEFFNWVLTSMAKVGGKVLTFAEKFITGFNKGLQKYKVLDVLTKPIQWILKLIADKLGILGRNMVDFADSYKVHRKAIKDLKAEKPTLKPKERFKETGKTDSYGNPTYIDKTTGKTVSKSEMEALSATMLKKKTGEKISKGLAKKSKKEVGQSVDELVSAGKLTKEEAKTFKEMDKLAKAGGEVVEEGGQIVVKKGSRTSKISKEKLGEVYSHIFKGKDKLSKLARTNPESFLKLGAEAKARREVLEQFTGKSKFIKNSKKLKKWKRSKFKRMLLLGSKYVYLYLKQQPDSSDLPDDIVNDMAEGVTDAMFKDVLEEQREEDGRLLSTEFDSFDKNAAETSMGYTNTLLQEQGLPQVHEWLYIQPDMEEYKDWFTETIPVAEIEKLDKLEKEGEGVINEQARLPKYSYIKPYDLF